MAEINKVRREKAEVTTHTTERCGNVRDHYEQLYANKMDSLEETDKFLERRQLLRLEQKEIENTSRPVTSSEIESVVKKLPTNKGPGPDGFTGEFYRTFREEIILTLLNKSILSKLFLSRKKWEDDLINRIKIEIKREHRPSFDGKAPLNVISNFRI